MRYDKFTMKAQEALATAQQIAMARKNTVVTGLHLLSTMLEDREGVIVMILKKIGSNVDRLADMVESELAKMPTSTSAASMIMPDPAF
ncbi:MAG: hypothetical protein KAS23_04175, partial [Anaerohalosphaera sp.]|nr:hypothetical protein [Anaerohalosphaera sp.]